MARSEEDSGYVVLMVAIAMPFLMGLLAFAIDVAHWRLVTAEVQKAADAGALAGATFLPQDMTSASTVATDVISKNKLPAGYSSTVSPGSRASQIKVTVTATVSNFTGLLLGSSTTTITRTAIAEYAGPVAMGSRCNLFGDEPPGLILIDPLFKSSLCSSTTGGFWANVLGPQSIKSNGDAVQATICSTGIDGCSGSTNTDYDLNGYTYVVKVSSAIPRLQIQAFDPAFVNVGDHCTNNLANIPAPLVGPDIYAPNDGPYCTGDTLYSPSSGDGNPPTTSFVVRAPSNNPIDPSGGPAIAGCTKQYLGFSGALSTPINANAYPKAVFRKWVLLCDIVNPVVGDYVVQVRTNVPYGLDAATQPGTPTMPGGGHNSFALRAGMPNDNTTNSKVAIHGSQAMSIFANVPGVVSEFYIAKIPLSAAGHVLSLKLFDIGDASQPGTIKVLPPPASGVTFTNCTGVGPASGTLASCSLTATSAFNGKWQEIKVPIPTGYQCVDSDPTDCWVRIQYNYGSGTQVQDITTWKASVEGDPVRLQP